MDFDLTPEHAVDSGLFVEVLSYTIPPLAPWDRDSDS
jgi:hypothetical protein